ncbi:glycine zipper 2TM domain-containing protein [Marinibacterium profundimaris]|uniref:glycine zipper 2TM domain-containing protein n=1 Tax=Marinibacterium profundimaris TaxID=1679460 RepID=UPI001E3F7EC5|nr:glycine zipper 2TM domain-containing protein [Marinibacterium profundimaris]
MTPKRALSPLALPAALALFAIQACAPADTVQGQQQRHEAACIGGTLAGGLVGGVVGSAFGGGAGRSLMTAVGAGAGMIGGNALTC